MNSLHNFLLCLFCGVSVLPLVLLTSHGSDNSGLFLGRYPIPEQTRSPININTKTVHDVKLSPFSLRAILSDKVEVVNNGKLIELRLDQNSTESRATGGPLGNDIYQFVKVKYIWTDDTNGHAATTIDGKGYPLEVAVIFFNKKYRTFENALNNRDGLAEVDFPIKICSTPNKKFSKYAPVLRKVRKARSSAKTTLGTTAGWFASGQFSPNDVYYAYPGSYNNATTGHFRYATTTIILPHRKKMCLSPKQFAETFRSFEDASGHRLTYIQAQYPANMPVVRAKKITNTNVA